MQGAENSAGGEDVAKITDSDGNGGGGAEEGRREGSYEVQYVGLVPHWVAMERANVAHENRGEKEC